MNIKKFFSKVIYGGRDARIVELQEQLKTLKVVKQQEIDKTNAYWKKRLYELKNKV